jgi:hypothetical protein
MGTIGLAHREQRDFVAEWGDAESPITRSDDVDSVVDRVHGQRGRTATLERPATADVDTAAAAGSTEHDWPIGEPTF